MAATTLLFADNASTTLAASITAGATSCSLAPGTGALFPNPGANQAFALSFVDAATGLVTEIVKVTAISGDTITTMVRGQEGTSARAWLAGDLASNFWTAGALGAGSMAQIGPLQQGTYGYAVDSGSANTVVLTLSPAITTYVDGLPINFKAAANNSGATTINVNGVGAVALQGAAGALQGGEIVTGKTYEANYNSTSNTFVLVGQGGGAEQIAPATQSQHAVQLGQATGRLLRTTIYTKVGATQFISVNGSAPTSTGATAFTALALTTAVKIKVAGGGGAGGGAPATTGTTVGVGVGGEGGAYGEGWFTSGFSSLTITVGSGGTATTTLGGTGGTSSAGALITAPGGPGGGAQGPTAGPLFAGNATAAAAPTGANLISMAGNIGTPASIISAGAFSSGPGGACGPFGANNSVANGTATGIQGVQVGQGGSGAGSSISTGSAQTGGAGGTGIVIIEEYA